MPPVRPQSRSRVKYSSTEPLQHDHLLCWRDDHAALLVPIIFVIVGGGRGVSSVPAPTDKKSAIFLLVFNLFYRGDPVAYIKENNNFTTFSMVMGVLSALWSPTGKGLTSWFSSSGV